MIHKTDYFFKTISFLFGVLKTLFLGGKKVVISISLEIMFGKSFHLHIYRMMMVKI